MIISGSEANKMHFKTHYFVYKQSKTDLLITLCYTVLILMTYISQSHHWIGLYQQNLQRGFP